jgi:hypothetical protein
MLAAHTCPTSEIPFDSNGNIIAQFFCPPQCTADPSDAAGIGHLRSHAFGHTYRTWLDSVGTPVGVQQRLMRHADIRTTMNIYGDVVTADMREASGKVATLALKGM